MSLVRLGVLSFASRVLFVTCLSHNKKHVFPAKTKTRSIFSICWTRESELSREDFLPWPE
jgi:hypothetical protein